jgi:hypothetical protein
LRDKHALQGVIVYESVLTVSGLIMQLRCDVLCVGPRCYGMVNKLVTPRYIEAL